MAVETPAAAAAVPQIRPTKPDEAAYLKELQVLESVHKANMYKLTTITAKINLAFPNKDNGKKDASPEKQRRDELIAERNEIRKKQTGFKAARQGKIDQLKRLDEQIKSRIAENKAALSKSDFKSTNDVETKIKHLKAKVNAKDMHIVDEKKALDEISKLNWVKKNIGQLEDKQKQIDDLKVQAKEIRDSLENAEQQAISKRYDEVQAELNTINAAADEIFKNLSSLRDERSQCDAAQKASWAEIRKHKDTYFANKRAYAAYEAEQRSKVRERQRAEREKARKEAQIARAQEMLQQASLPAFADEIHRATSLLKFLDPSAVPMEKAPLLANHGLAAKNIRKVEVATPENFRALPSKKDREDEYLAPVKQGKKGQKGKKGPAGIAAGASALETSRGFSCPPSIVQDCAYIDIDPPMSAAEVPTVVEKVKAKLDTWYKNQAAETQKNIEKAKKEIERLEKEDTGGGEGST